MALRIPIVASPISIDGLNLVNGEHIYIETNPQNYANRVLQLLDEKKERDRIVVNAYKLIKEEYVWTQVYSQYQNILFNN